MGKERVIVHVDMDAFFAAIEQRDNSQYRGKPVIVGAGPKGGRGRGVVATCSYEARKYGVRSAQPISEAYRRCPHAVFLPVRMGRYEEVSGRVRRILHEFTPDLEPVSIDEAFLDVTGSLHLFGTKRQLAERIRRRIEEETGLTASLGVASNKMVAKIASDMQKPHGLVIIEPEGVQEFLRPLAVGRLWGVGEKTQQALKALGVRTIGDLARLDRRELCERFGKQGEHLWNLAHGRDDSPVETSREAKSVGKEHTFQEDTSNARLIAGTLMRLCEDVAGRLRKMGRRGRTVTLKVRFEDFTTLTRSQTLDDPVETAPQIYRIASQSLGGLAMAGRMVRLIGVSVSNLQSGRPHQTSLLERAQQGKARQQKERLLGKAIDLLKERFGDDALRYGPGLVRRPREESEGEQ